LRKNTIALGHSIPNPATSIITELPLQCKKKFSKYFGKENWGFSQKWTKMGVTVIPPFSVFKLNLVTIQPASKGVEKVGKKCVIAISKRKRKVVPGMNKDEKIAELEGINQYQATVIEAQVQKIEA